MSKTATVVGAGIAGPTAAITLANHGYDVVTYEERSLPYEGSIHMITLERPIEDILWEFGIAQDEIYPRDFDMRHLFEESVGHILTERDEGWPMPALPARWNDVHNALAKRANVTYGHKVDSMPTTDIVVWADGIGSYGREHLSSRKGTYAGEMLFRGISPMARNDTAWYNLGGLVNDDSHWQMVSYPTWRDNGEWVRGWTLFAPMDKEPWRDTENLSPVQMANLKNDCYPYMAGTAYDLVVSALEVTCAPQIVWPPVGQMEFAHTNPNGSVSRHYVIGDANGTVSPRTGLGANEAIFAGSNAVPSWEWERKNVEAVNSLLDQSKSLIGESHGIHG